MVRAGNKLVTYVNKKIDKMILGLLDKLMKKSVGEMVDGLVEEKINGSVDKVVKKLFGKLVEERADNPVD